MKWFKHHTDLARHERMAAYLAECGSAKLEGYGFVMRVMELIAERMSTNRPDPSHTLSLRQWAHELDCHHNKVSKYLSKLEAAGWVTVTYAEGKAKVTCPELLDLADEYFTKSGRRPDIVRQEENRLENNRKEGDKTSASPTRRPLPDDFPLTPERRRVAETNCPGSDPDVVFLKFLAHQRSRSTLSADWEASWVKWTLGEHPTLMSSTQLRPGTTELNRQIAEMIRQGVLLIERRPDESDADFYRRANAMNERRIARLP